MTDWVSDAVAGLPAMATTHEVATVCRVSVRTIARWIAADEIAHARLGTRLVIPRRAVAEHLARKGGAS